MLAALSRLHPARAPLTRAKAEALAALPIPVRGTGAGLVSRTEPRGSGPTPRHRPTRDYGPGRHPGPEARAKVGSIWIHALRHGSMTEKYFFADVETPFHVWVREGQRWVLRDAASVGARPQTGGNAAADTSTPSRNPSSAR